jgi:nucleoside-diphosphate-sugar epimerase
LAKILIVGCGDLGLAIGHRLAHKHAVFGLRRQSQDMQSQGQPSNLSMLQADVTDPASLQVLPELKAELIIYCVAADAQTDAAYQAQYVNGLAHVLATQQQNTALRHVFFVSSTRVYGQDAGEFLDDTSPLSPVDFGGQRLLEAEQLLTNFACPTTALRLSGIYGPGRLRMINLAKSQTWPEINSWSNRIHRDDAAAFTVFLMEQVLEGKAVKTSYIVSDDAPASLHEVLAWLADQMQIGIPANAQQQASKGKRLANGLMRATGFQLKYPNFKVGYQALLASLTTP